jgi:hypothetical protein
LRLQTHGLFLQQCHRIKQDVNTFFFNQPAGKKHGDYFGIPSPVQRRIEDRFICAAI